MDSEKPKSLADQEADQGKDSVLLDAAYQYDCGRGRMLPKDYPDVRPELLRMFEELVAVAAKYKELTGRHLPVLGELGELFAEIKFGLKRHAPMTQGSDGMLGDDLAEVKTITPVKGRDEVEVKLAGNFVKLIVVKISDDFQFAGRVVHRKLLKEDPPGFATLSWSEMIRGARYQELHQAFPIPKASPERKLQIVKAENLEISRYLDEVLVDWKATRGDFPKNLHPPSQWPIPFFGNPAAALVATVGVNPSSGEFEAGRGWEDLQNRGQWKKRLRDYFKSEPPAHAWFQPWRIGLALLGVSYEAGTAVHLDVSYRATTAMLRNKDTDRKEFRQMTEKDVQWFFRLLPLCPQLRLLLVFGPMVGADGKIESLMSFLIAQAPGAGFTVRGSGADWDLRHDATGRVFKLHEVDTVNEKSVTTRVVKNLREHGPRLRRLIEPT